MISSSDINGAVADVLQCHLLDDIRVQLLFDSNVILNGHGEGWVDAVGWELRNFLLLTNLREFVAVNSADSEHFAILNAEFLVLTLVSL